jgi:hypothetical protein
MTDESLFREVDEGVHLVKRLTLTPNRGEPVVSWTIETTDSRILKPARTFGSKEELDLKLAVEGRRVGGLVDSAAQLVLDPIDMLDGYEFSGGTIQTDWFGIEEIEEGDSE